MHNAGSDFLLSDMARHVNDFLLGLCFTIETILSMEYYPMDSERILLQKNATRFLNAVLLSEEPIAGTSDSPGDVPQKIHSQDAKIIPVSGLLFDSILADRLIRLFFKEKDSKAIAAIMAQVCLSLLYVVVEEFVLLVTVMIEVKLYDYLSYWLSIKCVYNSFVVVVVVLVVEVVVVVVVIAVVVVVVVVVVVAVVVVAVVEVVGIVVIIAVVVVLAIVCPIFYTSSSYLHRLCHVKIKMKFCFLVYTRENPNIGRLFQPGAAATEL